jgi:prepilin-type N-terminal cleavage/methylation domain-containing protein
MLRGAGARGFAGRGLGFTLVELLVVIAVIAILAAIAFPVMVKAKQQAQIAECLTNMRQLGQAMHMYTGEYNDRFPPAVPLGIPWKTGEKTIQELLTPFARNGMIPVRAGRGFTYPYRSIFCCPSDTGILPKDDGYCDICSGKAVWLQTGCSYRYYANNQADYLRKNRPQVPWSGLAPEVRITATKVARIGAWEWAVVSPTRKAVLGDIWFWHLGDQVPPDNEVAFQNTLFADGHAARVKGEDHIEARTEPLRRGWHSYLETGN